MCGTWWNYHLGARIQVWKVLTRTSVHGTDGAFQFFARGVPTSHNEPGFRSSRREEAQTFWKKKIRASSRRLLQFMVPMRAHRWTWGLSRTPVGPTCWSAWTRGSASLPRFRVQGAKFWLGEFSPGAFSPWGRGKSAP